jgi:hypothetical protein
MAKKQKEKDEITIEQENNPIFLKKRLSIKELPANFTGIVYENYEEVYGATTYKNTNENYFYNGQRHRTCGLPAMICQYEISYLNPQQRGFISNKRRSYYLFGKKVSKLAALATKTNESKVILSFDGELSIGDDLTAYGAEDVLFALRVGEDVFIVNNAGRVNGKVTHAINDLLFSYKKTEKELSELGNIKTPTELAKMFHEMFSSMSVVS